MKAPLTVVTPTVEKTPANAKMVNSFLTRSYKKLAFALPSAEAHNVIAERERQLIAGPARPPAPIDTTKRVALVANEPVAIKRRIK